MADFSALKTAIQANIRTNGNEEITGAILQDILLSMVYTMGDGAINALAEALQAEITNRQNAVIGEATTRAEADSQLSGRINLVNQTVTGITTRLDEGYVYAGIATPSADPGTPAGKVFYIALQAGTYTNFSNLAVTQGINILKYNGSAWSQEQLIGIDDEPTAGSNNLVKSDVVYRNLPQGIMEQTIVSTNAWWNISFLAGKIVKIKITTTGTPTLNQLYVDGNYKRVFPLNCDLYFDFTNATEVKILWNVSAVATLSWELVPIGYFPSIAKVSESSNAGVGSYYTTDYKSVYIKNTTDEPHQIFPSNDGYTSFLIPEADRIFYIGEKKYIWNGDMFIPFITSKETKRYVKVMTRYGYISATGYIVHLDEQSTGCYVTDELIPVSVGDTIIYVGGYGVSNLYPLWGFSNKQSAGQKLGNFDLTGNLQCFKYTITDPTIKYVAAFGSTSYFPSLTVIPANETERLYDFVVASDGSGDCVSLHHTIQLARALESDKHINIFVKSGSYEMPVTNDNTQIFREGRNISIIGEDKNSVIIYNNNGTYPSMAEDATPLKLSGNVTLKNLTIRSLSTDYSGSGTPSSYCVHVDFNVEANSIMEIENCDMYNDHGGCIGAGLRDNFTLRIKGCNLYSAWPAQQNWNGAVVCHDGNQEGVGQKIELFDNILQCTGWRAVAITQAYGKTIDATFIGNALFSTGAEPYVFGAQTIVNNRTCLNNVVIPIS